MALLVRSEELVGLITIPEAIAAVREGYRDQAQRPAYSYPRVRIQDGDRQVSVHIGGCHDLQVEGAFIHAGRFTFVGGAQQNVRASRRVYVVYDSESAELRTIIVGSPPLFDDPPEERHASETAITSAVGTDALARPDCRVLGLFGTGLQARRHLVAFCSIRPGIAEVRVHSRSAANRAAFIRRMQPQVRARLIECVEPRDVVRGADFICLATSTNDPVLFGDWLEPGQHITSIVGSNRGVVAEGSLPRARRELDDEVIARSDRIVATLREQAIVDEQGDLFEPVKRGILTWEQIASLGEVVAGRLPGRQRPDEITLFKQNGEQGVGYMALAKLIEEKARQSGVGLEI